MAVERRAFLKLFGAGAAALITPLITDPTEILLVGKEALILPQGVVGETNLGMLTRLVSRAIATELSRRRYVLEAPAADEFAMERSGDGVFHVQVDPEIVQPGSVVPVDRYLTPVGALLADNIMRRKWRRLSPLPLPQGLIAAERLTSQRSGISVRGLMVYNIDEDRVDIRFAVAGAT